jgi:hypothetical protein
MNCKVFTHASPRQSLRYPVTEEVKRLLQDFAPASPVFAHFQVNLFEFTPDLGISKEALTPAEYQKLADVPPESEWLNNITNEKTALNENL